MTIKHQLQVIGIILIGVTLTEGWILYSSLKQANLATEKSRIADEVVKEGFEENVLLSEYLLHREERAMHLLQERGLDVPFIIVN